MKICTYNIESMTAMFDGDNIKKSAIPRANAIATVLKRINPDIIGICEGPRKSSQLQSFFDEFAPELKLKVVRSYSRGYENLLFAHRDNVEPVAIDPDLNFYDTWLADPDGNGLTKKFWWDKQPLEVIFKEKEYGQQFRVIQVHGPTKGILKAVSFFMYERISLAKRIQMVAEADRLRIRIEQLLKTESYIPFIIQGDMNDDPTLDYSERLLDGSYLSNLMGNIYKPETILHDALGYRWVEVEGREDLWTCTYEDPIIKEAFGKLHYVWIDHQLFAPSFKTSREVFLKDRSGRVDVKDEFSAAASDHYAIWCELGFNAMAAT
ncbi:endonuclease/exonuclease/phosphatase family protein [Sphingorhabdus sp.]|uniref:endonuclease/exonuclease/phosphatase family protein n=1 Tax=Sphingorhabdus sp. TaxID=1902408 RepID=UPI003459E904